MFSITQLIHLNLILVQSSQNPKWPPKHCMFTCMIIYIYSIQQIKWRLKDNIGYILRYHDQWNNPTIKELLRIQDGCPNNSQYGRRGTENQLELIDLITVTGDQSNYIARFCYTCTSNQHGYFLLTSWTNIFVLNYKLR